MKSDPLELALVREQILTDRVSSANRTIYQLREELSVSRKRLAEEMQRAESAEAETKATKKQVRDVSRWMLALSGELLPA